MKVNANINEIYYRFLYIEQNRGNCMSLFFREELDAQVAKQLAEKIEKEEQLKKMSREQQDAEVARKMLVST